MTDEKKRLPRWEYNIPNCAEDGCPMYDGKRCEELGARPSSICEPAVNDIVGAARNVVDAFRAVSDSKIGECFVVEPGGAPRLAKLRAAVNR